MALPICCFKPLNWGLSYVMLVIADCGSVSFLLHNSQATGEMKYQFQNIYLLRLNNK